MTNPTEQDQELARRNLRLGLILGAVAVTFFFAYILRAWWLGP